MKSAKVTDLQLHSEANRVPKMRPEEYAEFLVDVRERGVRVPLELLPGTKTILDGRTRWLAAKDAGLESVSVIDANLNGDDPVVYMLRAASKRRQLTDDQRAMLADEEREYLAEKGKQTRVEAAKVQGPRGKEGGRGHKKEKPSRDASSRKGSPARQKAAKVHQVGERKVRQAQKVKKHSKQLAQKVKDGEVKLAEAARQVDRERRAKEQEEKAKAAEEAIAVGKQNGEQAARIVCGDCLTELKRLRPYSARLIFADPPYNIGIDYGDGAKADRLPDAEYMEWATAWLRDCKPILTEDGSLWVLIGDEYAAEYGVTLKGLGYHIRSWIVWYETFGVNNQVGFNRTHRHLFYCVLNAKRFVFNADAVNRPSDRQAKYGDKRADPAGKVWDDVWIIPRLVGTAKERLPDFPTQLPLDLLRPIIGCASEPGDLIVDPFAGSATSGAAALELGRRYIGIEKNENYAGRARKRLLALSIEE